MKKKYLIFCATGSIGSNLAQQMYDEKKDCHLIGRNEKELKEISTKLNYSYSVSDVLKLNFFSDLGSCIPVQKTQMSTVLNFSNIS